MKTVHKFGALVAALGFSSLVSAAPFEGPYYSCVNTPAVEFNGTIVDAAVATPALSTLVDAVVAAGLADTLAQAENITVFAPTNAAFAKIPADVLNGILADGAALDAVLKHHVVARFDDPRRFTTPVRRETLSGQGIHYRFPVGFAKPRVDEASVNCQAVKTTNGVVWIIDSVLLPQF